MPPKISLKFFLLVSSMFLFSFYARADLPMPPTVTATIRVPGIDAPNNKRAPVVGCKTTDVEIYFAARNASSVSIEYLDPGNPSEFITTEYPSEGEEERWVKTIVVEKARCGKYRVTAARHGAKKTSDSIVILEVYEVAI